MGEESRTVAEHEAIEAWHFLPEDRRLHGCGMAPERTSVHAGQVLSVSPPLKLCRRGLHASVQAIDALNYAPGPVICRVLVWGEVIRGDDKLCGQHRRVLWMADASRALHRFACDATTEALDALESSGGKVNPSSRRAIEVKLAWLRGMATDADLDVAWCAVGFAEGFTARYPAWSAARDAGHTARCAAAEAVRGDGDAARAARAAARGAARGAAAAKQDCRLHGLFLALKPQDAS